MEKLKVIAISGSLRKASYNRKALQIAKKFASQLGAAVEEVDLKDLDLPLYDQDIEEGGIPDSVVRLKEEVLGSDILLIASPEYNHSISGVLKNAIDWLSRGENSLDGKVAAIFGVSTGMFGTLRGQLHLREILAALNVFVLPQPRVFIRFAHKAFNEAGSFVDEETSERLKTLVQRTLEYANKLKMV